MDRSSVPPVSSMAAETAASKLAVESSPGTPLRARLALPPSTNEETRALRRVAGLAPPRRAGESAPVGLEGELGIEPPGHMGPRLPRERTGDEAQADGRRPRRATPARLGLQATPGNEVVSMGRAMPPWGLPWPRRSTRGGRGGPSSEGSRLGGQLEGASCPGSASRNWLLWAPAGLSGGLPAGGRLYSASMGPDRVLGSNRRHRILALRWQSVAGKQSKGRR